MMLQFQQRVVDEKAELDDKLSRLRSFLSGGVFCGLPTDEQNRLIQQERVMSKYSTILGDRISAFCVPE